MKKWVVSAKRADFKGIAEKFQINQVTARIIRNRDIVGEEAIKSYLYGDLDQLYDAWQMKDMRLAVEIIIGKIAQKKKIRIIGDYDIDGVTATYILKKGLVECGALVDTDIPDRMKDGYGINEHLIQRASESGVDTIITCDNGIAAIDQISYAKSLGMTVIVTDHHDIPYTEEDGKKVFLQSEADAIVNPKQRECPYPFKNLCGAVVAWYFVGCLYEKMGIPKEKKMDLLEFAAIATVGDVMDLQGENRLIVKKGLEKLRNTKNIGLSALMEVCGILKETVSSYHIGFVMGPCLNASGRLDTAKKALSLLESKTGQEARELAQELKEMNDARKEMTEQGLLEAVNQIETLNLNQDQVLVVYLPEVHESLAGIIAGRIRELYHKPVFVLTKAESGVKGSGRSIEAFSMFDEMCGCRELFTRFGGHPMAAGLSMEEENLQLFRETINAQSKLTEEDFVEKTVIDVPMPIDYINESLVREFKLLEPFGKGNEKPVFADRNIRIINAKVIGKNRNVFKCVAISEKGTMIEALHFGKVEKLEAYITEKYGPNQWRALLNNEPNRILLSIIYYPEINEFRGNKTLQIVISQYQ